MISTGVAEKRPSNAVPAEPPFSKCWFCKSDLMPIGVASAGILNNYSQTNLLGCGHILCTKCVSSSLVTLPHTVNRAQVRCVCCKRVTNWTRFNPDGTVARDISTQIDKANYNNEQVQAFMLMRRLGEGIQKTKAITEESRKLVTEQRKKTAEVKNIISYHAYSIIMMTLGRYYQVMESIEEEEKKLSDYVASIDQFVKEANRKLAVCMFLDEKTKNQKIFPDDNTRKSLISEISEMLKQASMDTINADKFYKQLRSRELNLKLHQVKTKSILEHLKCWVGEIETSYRFDGVAPSVRRLIPVFDSRRRWDPRMFTELADSQLLDDNISLSTESNNEAHTTHNYMKEFDELKKLNVLNIPTKISIFDKHDYTQSQGKKTNNASTVDSVGNQSQNTTPNSSNSNSTSSFDLTNTAVATNDTTSIRNALNATAAYQCTSSTFSTKPAAPVQPPIPNSTRPPTSQSPAATTFINRPANGSVKPTVSTSSPQKEVRPAQDGPKRLTGAPPLFRPGGLTGAAPFTRPTLITQISSRSDDTPSTSYQKDPLKSPLYVVETNDSDSGNMVIPKIKIKLQREPCVSSLPVEQPTVPRKVPKPTRKAPVIEEGKNYTEDGRELDDDGECKYCYFCNGESEVEEDQGICNNCPRVFHAHCNMPPLKGTWEDTGDDWKCILCTNVDTQRAFITDVFDEQKRLLCYKVLSACYWNAYNVTPFKHPVKEAKYKKIISTPMDFSLIAKKLNKHTGPDAVTSTKQFIECMNLVFMNCSIFNEKESDVAHAGRDVWNLYRSAVEKYLPIHKKDVWLYRSLHAEYKAQKRKAGHSEKAGTVAKRQALDGSRLTPTKKITSSSNSEFIKQEEGSPIPQT